VGTLAFANARVRKSDGPEHGRVRQQAHTRETGVRAFVRTRQSSLSCRWHGQVSDLADVPSPNSSNWQAAVKPKADVRRLNACLARYICRSWWLTGGRNLGLCCHSVEEQPMAALHNISDTPDSMSKSSSEIATPTNTYAYSTRPILEINPQSFGCSNPEVPST
jgi:hypothetical protein